MRVKKLAILISSLFKEKIKIKKNKVDSNYVDKYIPNIKKIKNDLKVKINYSLVESLQLTINQINDEKKN